ncbi:hypothetical protein [Paenibacillus ehimensis]|uniref:DUF4829 domain-containing protein n=1 Tax=Paenibacillus ehimensis TaxID=79264 RepID=A0ABT8VLH2_9BACL|nr:hypothetical protein [Paenibacillus ehimensis]MDO3681815.1 hypothetical protein [Paenibacillus ehimensis]
MARSPQLPDRVKAWAGIIIGLLLIALFVGAFFSGRRTVQLNDNESAAKHEHQETHRYEAGPTPDQPTSDNLPITEKVASDAQAVLPDFLKAYVPFDSEHPDVYVDRSKPFITEHFYKELSSLQRRGTLSRVKTEYVAAEWTPADLKADQQWYNVDVKVTHTDINGQQKKSLLLYVVMLKLVEGHWKVDDVGIRTGSGAIPE